MGLSEAQTQQMRELLETSCAQAREHIEQLKERSRPVSLDDPIGRVSRIDAIQHQEMALAGLRREEELLQRLIAALDRLDGKSFGSCQRCKAPIAFARLLAMPDAQHCVSCAR